MPAVVGGDAGADFGVAFSGFAPAFLAYGETSFDVNEAKLRTPLPPMRVDRLAPIAPDDDETECADEDGENDAADEDTDTADRLLLEST